MSVYDPTKYPDENEGQDFTVPKGLYELYFSELSVQEKNGKRFFGGKVTFADGPRAGKYFFHSFWIFNEDKDKRKQALTWMGNFFRAVGIGAVDIDIEADKLLNLPFFGDVDIDEYEGKKRNKLLPWGFHAVTGILGNAAPSNTPPAKAEASADEDGFDPKVYEDDVPF